MEQVTMNFIISMITTAIIIPHIYPDKGNNTKKKQKRDRAFTFLLFYYIFVLINPHNHTRNIVQEVRGLQIIT